MSSSFGPAAQAAGPTPHQGGNGSGESRAFVTSGHIRALLGICLTWGCFYIFWIGLNDATLDGEPFAFPVTGYDNLQVFVAAPLAQSVLYVLARKTSWLLNLYLAISVVFLVYAGLHLVDGYRLTYWHQGDLLCRQGCDDVWVFGWLVLAQGIILMFSPSVFRDFSGFWQLATRLGLAAMLLWLASTSFALMLSM